MANKGPARLHLDDIMADGEWHEARELAAEALPLLRPEVALRKWRKMVGVSRKPDWDTDLDRDGRMFQAMLAGARGAVYDMARWADWEIDKTSHPMRYRLRRGDDDTTC